MVDLFGLDSTNIDYTHLLRKEICLYFFDSNCTKGILAKYFVRLYSKNLSKATIFCKE